LKIEYQVSLAHSLLATAGLVCAAPHFEGLSDRLWELRTRVPADLLTELCLLITFPGGYQRFTSELIGHLPDGAAAMGYRDLLDHLQSIPGIHYQLLALRALARGSSPRPPASELAGLLDDPGAWAAFLAGVESEVPPETVGALVRDGEELKRRLLAALSRFWQAAYADEFAATRPLMERSVAHQRAQPHNPVFHDTFVAITGRLVPETIKDLLPGISRATFVPSCYVGPYVAYSHYGQDLIVYYNCRSTPLGPDVAGETALYPPLKALADETRLQILALLRGRELYAQEIVERLDISQPAVSRHLNLMAAAGVLKSRRDGNAKYYSLDGETLARLADAIRALV
ncbi:MAG: metalloregulator ArsR/SmtB family transcription factor, partial [Anaerolineae bacterium]